MPDDQPVVPVHLTLPSVGPGAEDAVSAVVADHLRALRLPGRPEVAVAAGGGTTWGLRVNGTAVRCPAPDVAGVVHAVTHGRGHWLEDVPPEAGAALAAGLCSAALQARLSVLLGPAQLAAVLDGTGGPPGVEAALRTVVEHGVALDGAALAEVVGGGRPTPVEVAERLLERGQAETLDVRLAPATLRRLTSGTDTDVFPALREDLYDRLGVLGPDFHLAADPSLPEDGFAFTLGVVRTWPRHLPAASGLPDVADALGELLRRRAAWFISMRTVEEMSDRLEVVLPDTMRTVRERYPLEWLTAVARAAVDEGTSLRNLATVLDRLLDLDPHPSADTYRMREGSPPQVDRGTGDLPAPRDAVALVRQRLREEVARTTTAAEVLVHRLPPELEERLDVAVRAGAPSAADAEAAAAEAREVAWDGLPLVAPSLALRGWLRDTLRGELPELEVVALTEYPPALTVRAV